MHLNFNIDMMSNHDMHYSCFVCFTDRAPLSSVSSDNASASSSHHLRHINLSPVLPSNSPTRSCSPWPPTSEANSEELEVKQNLKPSEGDSSLLEEEILASLHSHTLDPHMFP